MESVVLIGMPGTGKSTVGVLLAKALGLGFVDTDILIQLREKRTLQDIIREAGYKELRAIEEQVVLENDYTSKIIATGGSVVHSAKSMEKLKQAGKVIYLSCGIDQLRSRIDDFDTRGIAAPVGQPLEETAKQRVTLYELYADYTVDTSSKTPAEIVQEILQLGLDSVIE